MALLSTILALSVLAAGLFPTPALSLRTLDLKGHARSMYMPPADVDVEIHVTPDPSNREVYVFCTSTNGDCGSSQFGLNGANESPVFHRKLRDLVDGTYEIQVTVIRQSQDPLRQRVRFQVGGSDPQ